MLAIARREIVASHLEIHMSPNQPKRDQKSGGQNKPDDKGQSGAPQKGKDQKQQGGTQKK